MSKFQGGIVLTTNFIGVLFPSTFWEIFLDIDLRGLQSFFLENGHFQLLQGDNGMLKSLSFIGHLRAYLFPFFGNIKSNIPLVETEHLNYKNYFRSEKRSVFHC